MSKYIKIIRSLFAWIVLSSASLCAVPLTLQYQGHIIIDGLAFEGLGAFKFALLDDTGGSLWSNDGASVDGAEPVSSVSLEMERGIYRVELGSLDYENMTEIASSVFAEDIIYLRIWFSDGVSGFQLLDPDTKVGAVAFSIHAESVAYASVAGSVESIPDGLIEDRHFEEALLQQIDTFNELTQNLMAISSDLEDPGLLDLGFAPFSTLNKSEWLTGSTENQPSSRFRHGSLWMDGDWMIWGGMNSGLQSLGSGGIYSFEGDKWSAISTLESPSARWGMSLVWTGEEAILWGGSTDDGLESDGFTYDPGTQSWSEISNLNAPEARVFQSSVWTGSSLAVFGGRSADEALELLSVYDKANDTWSEIDLNFLPAEKSFELVLAAEIIDPDDSGADNNRNGADEELPMIESARDVEIHNGLAIVAAAGNDSLSFFDISDPVNPELVYTLIYRNSSDNGVAFETDQVGSINRLNTVWASSGSGDILVSVSTNKGVAFFDISDVTSPTMVSFIDDNEEGGNWSYLERPHLVRLYEDILLLGNDLKIVNDEQTSFAALNIIDVVSLHDKESASRDPQFINRIKSGDLLSTEVEGETQLIEMDGEVFFDRFEDTLFLGTSEFPYVYIIDIATPTEPIVLSRLADGDGDFNYLGYINGIEISKDGKKLFVASSGVDDAVTLINVEDLRAPLWLSEIRNNTVDDDSGILYESINGPSVSVEGNILAIVGTNSHGLALVNIEDPARPKLIDQIINNEGFVTAMASPRNVALHHQVAYVVSAGTPDSLVVVDLAPEPSPRIDAEGVWTGESWLLFGGQLYEDENVPGFEVKFVDGEPVSWYPLSDADAPSIRTGHTAVWTGDSMIVWGGSFESELLNDGAVYDYAEDSWVTINLVDAPSARKDHVAVWSGKEMLILGGSNEFGDLDDGYAYDPSNDSWRELTKDGLNLARSEAHAVWNGEEVMLFGGRSGNSAVGALQLLNPEPDLYLFRKR